MANEKSVFKFLRCSTPGCGYKKTDPTGKAKAQCKNCGATMRHSDTWYARITHNGKTILKSVSTRKRDAEDYIATCKLAQSSGNLMPGQEKDTSWPDAVKNTKQWWRDSVLKGDIAQSSANFYGFNLVALNKYFSQMSLLTIKKKDVLDYQTERVKKGISNTTINHELTTLRRIYSLHLDRTSSDESPKLYAKHQDLARVKKLEQTTEKVRFLASEEAKALMSASTPVVRLAILIGLNTGLRKANVMNLAWKHINLKERLIKLPGSVMKNRQPHTVDMPAQLVAELREWKISQPVSHFVFAGYEGDNPERTIRNDFEKAVKAAELHDVTFHTLRHTFASQWLMSGGDLTTLSEVLSHSSIQITKDLYGHLSREHKRKAHDEFAAAFLDQLY
jgi:integrase